VSNPSHAKRLQIAESAVRGDVTVALALSGDDDPSVRSSALLALCELHSLTKSIITDALMDPSPLVRQRILQLAARRSVLSVGQLVSSLDDPDATVVEAAATALGEYTEDRTEFDETVSTALARVASEHSDELCRESAVAALGAIGAELALPTIIAALDDRPNIRRRSIVALTAFDDPRAQEAMRSALQDNDRQVRALAEELLD
jgi:HEAT repeat protein